MESLGESETPPVGGASVVDLLKQDYQELAASTDVYIPINGWGKSGLAARYVLPESGKELDQIGQKVIREVKGQYDRNVLITLDTLIHLNTGLYVRPSGVEEYVELDPEESGNPVSYKDLARLCPIFGWSPDEVKTARIAVRKLFANNDMPLLLHGEKLQRWMVDTKADVVTEFWESGEVR